jgi:hypothetical protein
LITSLISGLTLSAGRGCGLISLFIILPLFAFSQAVDLKDGLYLSIDDFRYNHPIPPVYLINKLDIRNPNFLDSVVELSEVRYYDALEEERSIKPEDLWGYCRGGIPFINSDDQWARITVVGSLCHFTSWVEKVEYQRPDVYGGGYQNVYPYSSGFHPVELVTNELVENIIDLQTAEIERFTIETLKKSLQRDDALYKDFSELKKREQKDLLFRYLILFNKKHQFQFPQ